MSVEVRPARLEDIADVLRLERAVPDLPHWGEGVYGAIVVGDDGALRRMLLVAADAGRVVGFAVGAVVLDEAELESVAVDASARRQGIGVMLCETLVVWAHEQGARRMRLEVRQGNEPARELYARLGFGVEGLRRGYYSSPTEDAVILARHWE